MTHGCHCSKWTRRKNVGGSPIDDLDFTCRELNAKLRCLQLPGGACSDGIDFTFYTVQTQQNNKLSEDVDFHCAFAGNACKTSICKIEFEFAQKLFELLADNGPGSYYWYGYNSDAECTPQVPKYFEKTCVGEAPNVFIHNA